MLTIKKTLQKTYQVLEKNSRQDSYLPFIIFSTVLVLIGILPFAGYFSPHNTSLALSAMAIILASFIFIKGSWFGLQSILYVLPLAQLAAIPVWVQGGQRVYLRVLDVVVFATVVVWFFDKAKYRKWRRPDSVETALLGFFLIIILSLIVNSRFLTVSQLFYSLMYPVRWITYGLLFFIVRDSVGKLEDRRTTIVKLLIGAGVSVAIAGLAQFMVFPNIAILRFNYRNYDLGFLRPMDLDPHAGRLLSTLLDPNYAGGFLALILIVVFSQIIFLEPTNKVFVSSKQGLWRLVPFAILLTAFVLTYSRGSQLALVAGTITVAVGARFQGRTEFYRAVSMLLFIIIVLVANPAVRMRYNIFEDHTEKHIAKRIENSVEKNVGNRFEYSTQARLKTWYQGLKIFRGHPVFGVGYNAYKWYSQRFSVAGNGTQNSFITLLATTGLIGLMAFFWFIRQIVRTIMNARNALLPGENWIMWTSYGVLVVLAVHALFIESLFYPPILVYMWILLGLIPNEEVVHSS